MTITEQRLFDYAEELQTFEEYQLECELRAQTQARETTRHMIANSGPLERQLHKQDLFLIINYIQCIAAEMERRYMP